MTEFPSVTAYLSWDHDRLGALFAEAVRLVEHGEFDAARTPFESFEQGIRRHMRLEEELLFPILEARTGLVSGPTQVLRTEHHAIAQAVSRMAKAFEARDAAAFAQRSADVVEVLGPHHRREEEILYPMTDRSLPEPERSEITKKLLAFS